LLQFFPSKIRRLSEHHLPRSQRQLTAETSIVWHKEVCKLSGITSWTFQFPIYIFGSLSKDVLTQAFGESHRGLKYLAAPRGVQNGACHSCSAVHSYCQRARGLGRGGCVGRHCGSYTVRLRRGSSPDLRTTEYSGCLANCGRSS
jgi:hypothetical protein